MTKIRSMTGFGRCEVTDGTRKISVEMKSVNHRYLDINIKIPKKLSFFETAIRGELKEYIQRGKVDIFITYEDTAEANLCVKYNRELAAEYMKYLWQMSEDFSLDNDVRVSTLSRYPEVLTMEEQTVDEEALWQFLAKAVHGAAESFVETRAREGENIRDDLLAKLSGMLALVEFIEHRSPQIIQDYKQRLREKVRELLEDTQIDENRLLTEVTIFADKVCVDEELVRLKSHIATTRDCLVEGGGIGRKLDFLAQEMNREANTILSKTTDLEISNRAIELKTEIEKIREQIQNIE
ncbi:MAG: YicC family protein [Bacteroidales bacterium]|nr:YicC family protein [Bacteroidales bacterium]MCM1416710.1 YicC family protein [bacterium]MCM1424416.1 YicC family protein [bacterium]